MSRCGERCPGAWNTFEVSPFAPLTSLVLDSYQPTWSRSRVAPKGMGLNDFVAMQEGFFAAEGLGVEFDWKTFRGTQSSWNGLDYFQRPQDRPYTEEKQDVVQGTCVWGTICNASAGMGRVVTEGFGVASADRDG